MDDLLSEASGNLDRGLHEMDAQILRPTGLSQRYNWIENIYMPAESEEEYRVVSFSGGRVENFSAHPLTVLRAAVSFV